MTVSVKSFSKIFFKNTSKVLYLFFALIFISCEKSNSYIDISGPAMGTSYTIRLIPKRGSNSNINLIKAKIDSTLESINDQMSTYIINSDISLFNKIGKNTAIIITNDFKQVILRSIYWSKKSNGAFDITSLPLTNVWRKGKKDREYEDKWEPPSDLDIIIAKDKVGFKKIKISQNSLVKTFKGQQIDVNAIAKGWGVDQLFKLVESYGYKNFMIEIGGEVRVSGENIQNKPWQIGIDYPLVDTSPGEKIIGVVPLINKSMATSGNYRNFYEYDSKKYSHIIDPRTGYAIESSIASVTVVSELCMDADAIATALNVMSLESGKEMVEKNDGIEAFWVISKDGKFSTVQSAGMNVNLLD